MKHALSQEALRQVVAEQQAEKTFFQNLPQVEREKAKEFIEALDKNWIKVVIGIRRCGKSMLCHQALKGMSYGYLNFDDERLIGLEAVDLNKMLQFLLEINQETRTFFFDEIQNVPGWELFVNRLQRQGYNIIITGSNSKLLSKELSTHLTGRYVLIELFPFSFREFLLSKHFAWREEDLLLTQNLATLYALLNEYLLTGGFPDIAIGGFHAPYLRELYDKIISRDITYRYGVKYSKTLKEIALYCHANLGSRFSFHKVKNTFELRSVHTTKNYFQYLVDAYLIFLLNAFSFKYKEQVRQPRKLYTIDNGLSSAISPKFSQDRGAALENLVFQELLRQGKDLTYWASQEGEVDFVVAKDRKIEVMIQVSWSLQDSATRKREIKALTKAAKSTGCRKLLVITWEEEDVEEVEGDVIRVTPVWKWLLGVWE